MAVKSYELAFNRGVISPLSRSRADVKRVAMSAQDQINWVPRTLGPMSLRPGLGYLGNVATANGAVKNIPFIFSLTDTALIEVTDQSVRVRVNEVLISRASVATAVANGTFNTDLTSWANADEGAGEAVSSWVAPGYMQLEGSGISGAIRTQTLTVAGGDQNVEHALHIVIAAGNCTLRVGSAAGLDDYISETVLAQGVHSLAFTPTGASVYLQLINRSMYPALVDACTIESAGVMVLGTSLLPTETLDDIRYVQSGDILFIARGRTRPPVKIERRSTTSWSVVYYYCDKGPLLTPNVGPITMTPSAIVASGPSPTVTITASKSYFKSSNVGSILSITSVGQLINGTLSALNAATSGIRVTGIGDARRFTINISGTWNATVDLQQSITDESNYTTIATYTTNQAITHNDTLDNQIIYYRLKISIYTSGSAVCSLSIPSGFITGYCRISAYTSPTSVTAYMIKAFGNVTASTTWAEGAWSDRRGYPTAITMFGGRMWWAGKNKVWGTVVDDYYNFDVDYLGDAGPISRSIGTGPVDTINWLIPLRNLIVGAQTAEHVCRSTGFDEPLTPNNFNMRDSSNYGSAAVEPVKLDDLGIFVDKTGYRVMEVLTDQYDSITTDELSILTPEICYPAIKRIAVQRRPETRIHLLKCDGTVVLLTFDKIEDVKCFTTIETEGLIEDIAVIPGAPEDTVYYTVARVVGGVIVRYLEKWALNKEITGGTVTKLSDAWVEFNGASTTTITGLSHLEGKSVVCWANNKDQGTFTVASGSITIPEATTYAVTGLPYTATFTSNKLGFDSFGPPSLNKQTRISRIGLLLKDVYKNGIQYGTDINYLDDLPPVEDESTVAANTIWSFYDENPLPINGTFSFNTRLVLTASSPRPCTVLGVVINLEEGFNHT